MRLKGEGGEAFRIGAWAEAQAHYHNGARLLLDESPVDGYASLGELRAPKGRENEARATLVGCWLNEAACALRREEWSVACTRCSAVLEKLADPLGADVDANVKAHFRRGKALANLSDFERARADVREASRLAPANREVRAFWDEMRSMETERAEGGKAVLAKMSVTAGLYKGLHLRPKRRNTRPRVWFDVAIGGKHVGRVTFELFVEAVPRTCENFRALCTGEHGLSPRSGKPLCYRGSTFHRAVNLDDEGPKFLREGGDGSGRDIEIWKGMFVHGGDIVHYDGSGSDSIYGEAFADEAFDLKHSDKYLLSMAGTPPMRNRDAEARTHAPNRNGSQFFITTKSTTANLGGASITHFDYRHVVFGRVASCEGVRVVNAIQNLPTEVRRGHRIIEAVVITDCGQLPDNNPDEPPVRAPTAEADGPTSKAWFEAEAEAYADAALDVPQIDPDDNTVSAEVDD